MTTVHDLLDRALSTLGITQAELARRIPMSDTNLSKARARGTISDAARTRIEDLIAGRPSEPLPRRPGRPTNAHPDRAYLALTAHEHAAVKRAGEARGGVRELVDQAITAYVAAGRTVQSPPTIPPRRRTFAERVTPEVLATLPAERRREHLRAAVIAAIESA